MQLTPSSLCFSEEKFPRSAKIFYPNVENWENLSFSRYRGRTSYSLFIHKTLINMKSLLLTLIAASMPIMAQETAPAPAPDPAPQPPPACHKPHFKHILAKFDANKDGQLDEQEKAAMKTAFEARKAEFEKKMLEKFDANKDGQLDDQEKAAMKAAFEARKAEFEKKMLEKFDANKDGQLDDQEKAAMKEEFSKRCGPRGPHRHGHGPAMRGHHPGCCWGAPGPQGRRPAPQGCPCCAPPPPCCRRQVPPPAQGCDESTRGEAGNRPGPPRPLPPPPPAPEGAPASAPVPAGD